MVCLPVCIWQCVHNRQDYKEAAQNLETDGGRIYDQIFLNIFFMVTVLDCDYYQKCRLDSNVSLPFFTKDILTLTYFPTIICKQFMSALQLFGKE